MSIGLYKVAQEFEHEGKKVLIGTEIVMKDRDADSLIKKKMVVEGRFLDPEDPKDKVMIKAAEKKHKAKYDVNAEREKERGVGKKTRDEKKDEEEKAEKEEAMAGEDEDVVDESPTDTPPVPPKSGRTPKKKKS